jgi:tripartite-type tricarboxylate transporter receptor subunit TctC
MIRILAGLLALLLGAFISGGGSSPALAQAGFPNGPIRVIIPLPPGGAIDVMVRSLGRAFEQRNPYGLIVESRPGANTILAANACKAAAPDGRTICLLSSSTVSLNPTLYRNLSYNPLKDFEPITNVAFADQVLVLNNKVPVKDWKELVDYSKNNPRKLNFGSFGLGGDTHLIVEWLKQQSGATITHIPYKGAPDAMLAFTANDIQLLYLIVGNMDIVRQVNEGEVKGLLVPGAQRSALIPGVPSFAEVGLTSEAADYQTWFGLFAPKGTPPEIVAKLNAQFAAILHSKAFVDENLAPRGFRPVGDSAADFAKFIVADAKRGKVLVDQSGIQLDQ